MSIFFNVGLKNQHNLFSKDQITSFRQRGFTLVETLLVIAIATVILTAALAMYTSTRSGQIASQMVRDTVSVQAGIQSLFNAQSDYTGLSNEVLFKAKKIPSTLKYDSGVITTEEGGMLSVTGSGNQYNMTITNVSPATCFAMLSSLNSGWRQVKVNSTVVASSPTDFPVTVSKASLACGSEASTIVYTGGVLDNTLD